MSNTLSSSARRVQRALKAHGLACQIVEMAQTTRSAKEAAQAVGCRVEQIVKSLVFKRRHTQKAILVLVCGANRVNEEKLRQLVSEPVEMPDADFVRQKTGFAIGGVPPIGHNDRLETFIDEDVLKFEEIWAAAGNPHAVFKLTPTDLQKMTGGRVVRIK